MKNKGFLLILHYPKRMLKLVGAQLTGFHTLETNHITSCNHTSQEILTVLENILGPKIKKYSIWSTKMITPLPLPILSC